MKSCGKLFVWWGVCASCCYALLSLCCSAVFMLGFGNHFLSNLWKDFSPPQKQCVNSEKSERTPCSKACRTLFAAMTGNLFSFFLYDAKKVSPIAVNEFHSGCGLDFDVHFSTMILFFFSYSLVDFFMGSQTCYMTPFDSSYGIQFSLTGVNAQLLHSLGGLTMTDP